MKKFMKIILPLLLGAQVAFATPEKAAENTLKLFHPIFKDRFEVRDLEQVDKKKKISFLHKNTKYVLYYGLAKKGEEFTIDTKFYKNWDYVVIASGDDKVSDIDVYIYDSKENVVSIDRNPGKNCFPKLKETLLLAPELNNNKNILNQKVSLRPINTGSYKIKVKVRESKPNSYWTLLISSAETPK